MRATYLCNKPKNQARSDEQSALERQELIERTLIDQV